MKKKLLIILFVVAFIAFGIGYYKYTQYYYGAKCYQEFSIKTEEDTYTVNYAPAMAIPVSLDNPSRNAIDSSNSYYLSYHLLDADGKEIETDGCRTPIDVNPFSTQDLEMSFEVPEAGTYILVLDIVKEGEFWFENMEGQPTEITVTVK